MTARRQQANESDGAQCKDLEGIQAYTFLLPGVVVASFRTTALGLLLVAFVAFALSGCGHSVVQPELVNCACFATAEQIHHLTWNSQSTAVACILRPNREMDDTQIAIAVADGEEARLTEADACHTSPAWSPDGKRLAWLRHEPQSARTSAWVSDLATHSAHKVAEVSSPSRLSICAWSPSGRWLGLVNPVAPQSELLICNPATHRIERRLLVPEGAIGDFSWSPNERYVAATAVPAELPSGGMPAPVRGVLVFDLSDGSRLSEQVPVPSEWLANDVAVAWDTDGALRLGTNHSDRAICISYSSKSNELARLLDESAGPSRFYLSLSWRLDAPAFAAVSVSKYRSRRSASRKLVYADTSGAREVRVPGSPQIDEVAWSPDGRWLAIVTNRNQLVFCKLPAVLPL